MARFYFQEDLIIDQVPTYLCAREDDCRRVLDHVGELVIKAVNEAGGYAMLVGPRRRRNGSPSCARARASSPSSSAATTC